MKNKKGFFLSVASSVFFLFGTVLMLFSNTLISGTILLLLGFFVAIIALSNKNKFLFSENFLFMSSVLSLIILAYIFFIVYSRNVIIISSSFYALNFLIQVNDVNTPKIRVVKSKKAENIKKAIQDLKSEISKKSETYFYSESGKSFHLGGCIGLSRTKKDNLKTSKSRKDLIDKGFKTCKICNS